MPLGTTLLLCVPLNVACRLCTTSQPRKGDVTGCQFGALVGGFPGGVWRLPPPHWVVVAPGPPPVAPGSARNTRSHDSPLHPVPMWHARGARQKSSKPPLDPRAPRSNPLRWPRLTRRAVLRAGPRAPGLASRKLIYLGSRLNPSVRCGRTDTCEQTV
jgi:hypothetical protein